MASSIREQILVKFAQALEVICPGAVYRTRVTAIRKFPSVVVRPDTESVVNHQFDRSDRDLVVEIEIHQAGENSTLQEPLGVTSDEAADSVLNQVHAAVMADDRMGGLALQVSPIDVDWQYASAEQPRILVTMRYSVRYRHAYRDFTQQL